MTKIHKLILVAGILSTASSQAIQVSIAKGTGSGITVLDSTDAAQATFKIAVGTFDASPNKDLAGFNEFGTATSASNLVTGSFNSSFGTAGYPDATKFNNKNIFIVITNNLGTERAILGKGTSASNDWLFPADVTPALAATESLDTNNATRVAASFGSVIDNLTGVDNVKLVSIVPIPEPTTSTLSGLMIVGLLASRRRK